MSNVVVKKHRISIQFTIHAYKEFIMVDRWVVGEDVIFLLLSCLCCVLPREHLC